ncbi:MAG TPA: PDZ domain-containing protein, partial [Terriglobales bacterium]|nr:PDZ domain-containing protein [Terriglobales bacterium]
RAPAPAAKLALLFLACLCLVSLTTQAQSASQSAASADIAYTVSLADPPHHLVRVSIALQPGPDERQLQMPVWNALYEVRDFAQYVLDVTAKSASGQVLPVTELDKTTWSISGAAQGLTVTYDIYADAPAPFGAQLNEHHAYFNLAEILMYPAGHTRDWSCALRVEQLPATWTVAVPLHSVGRPGEYAFTAPSYDRLVDSPVEASAFREADFDAGGATYRVVVDAAPADYDMNALIAALRKIVTAETAWMNDRPFDQYLFLYHFPRGPAGGGMEHAYSTAISTSADRLRNDSTAPAAVSAHEFFHLWNVKRIRPQTLEPIDYAHEMYTRALWFSEGVTSTVGNYALLQAGIIDERGYLRHLGGVIGTLQDRPAHLTQSAEESSLDTWLERYPFYRQPERSIDYYGKGEILGVLLDLKMREATHGAKSLRDLFHYLNDEYAKKGRFFPDPGGIADAAKAVTGADFAEFFREYVGGTTEIPYNNFFQTVGLTLNRQMRLVPDPGFRTIRAGNNEGTVVSSVDEGSNSAKAGLLAGDILEEVDGAPVTGPLQPYFAATTAGDRVTLRVLRGSKRLTIRFAMGVRQTHEYVLTDIANVTPEQRARRQAWLKGEDQ